MTQSQLKAGIVGAIIYFLMTALLTGTVFYLETTHSSLLNNGPGSFIPSIGYALLLPVVPPMLIAAGMLNDPSGSELFIYSLVMSIPCGALFGILWSKFRETRKRRA